MKITKRTANYIGMFCLMIGLLCGVTACGGASKGSETKYIINAQDAEGKPLSMVAVQLFDSKGTALVQVPEYSNSRGEVQFKEATKGKCYVQVVDTPEGYKLDSETKHYFDADNKVVVVCEEGVEEVAEEENFVGDFAAMIKSKKYATFTEAMLAVNSAKSDVTVVLNQDVEMTGSVQINNENDVNVIIDGNGHTVTTGTDGNAFAVDQSLGSVEFKNMKINHRASGCVVRSGAGGILTFTDVTITTNEAQTNAWGLFNFAGNGVTSTFNLIRTNISMKAEATTNTKTAVIRTGNDGMSNGKTVVLNIEDCKIDATAAPGRAGIMIMNSTKAEITIKNSSIKTADGYPISCNSQPLTLENTTFSSTVDTYNAIPIHDKGTVISNNKSQQNNPGVVAKIGDKEYDSLTAALLDAYQESKDVLIEMTADATIASVSIQNSKGKNITIDGHGHTVTTEHENNAFNISQSRGEVTICNMKIVHKNYGAAIRQSTAGVVNLTDITIDATQGDEYRYFIINLPATKGTSYMNMTRVNVTMAVESAGNQDSGIIRTGNGGESDKKTVVLNMTDCNFDATGAAGRAGIVIMSTTTAYVKMTNTNIKTKDMYPIRTNRQNFELYNCKLSCESALFKNALIEDDANVIKK